MPAKSVICSHAPWCIIKKHAKMRKFIYTWMDIYFFITWIPRWKTTNHLQWEWWQKLLHIHMYFIAPSPLLTPSRQNVPQYFLQFFNLVGKFLDRFLLICQLYWPNKSYKASNKQSASCKHLKPSKTNANYALWMEVLCP